jgi:hypothetical protein
MTEMTPVLRRAARRRPGEPAVKNHRLELPPELPQDIVVSLRCRKNMIL